MGLRQCHGVSQGADKRKILPREEIAVEFIVLDNKKRRPFHLKDNIMSPNGKLARRLNIIAPKKAKYGKPNVAIFNSFNFICSFVLCVQLCV